MTRTGAAPRRRTACRTPALLVALAVALAVTLAAALTGCTADDEGARRASTTEAAPAAVPPVTVVVLGSSTAAAYGLDDPADGWVARYAAALEADDERNEVVNLAVSGFSTFQVLPTGTPTPEGRSVDPAHNVTAALALDPDALVVNLPSNDAATGIAAGETMANLATVAEVAAADGVEVWVTTTQPRALDASGRALLAEVRDRILETYGDHAVDVWTGLAAADGTIDPAFDQGDGIHLTTAGHESIAQRVAAAQIPRVVAGR